MTKLLIIATIVLASLSMSSPTSATTYRWIDTNGVVNYSERKPRGVAAELVTAIDDAKLARRATARPVSATTPVYSPTPTPRSNTPTKVDPNLSETQQNMLQGLQAAEQIRQQQITQIRQDNCARSRRVLNNLSSLGRIRVTAKDGSQSVMDDEDRSRRISEAQQGVASNCDS